MYNVQYCVVVKGNDTNIVLCLRVCVSVFYSEMTLQELYPHANKTLRNFREMKGRKAMI